MLGELLSAAQMISYDVSIGFIIINECICAGSFNLNNIGLAQVHSWFVVPLIPMFIIFC